MTYQEFVDALLQALYPILLAVITAAAGALSQRLFAYLSAHFSEQQLSLGREIASHAVEFVEQVFKDVHGPEKLNAALRQAKEFGAKYGVRYTDEQWKALIEAALHDFNTFWKKAN